FAIRERLGGGGMGEVYRADDTKLHCPVALKRVSPQLRADPRYRQRLLKEAERASRLRGEAHIATIFDVLEQDGELFLVMEYVEGETLRQRLRRPLGIEPLLAIAVQCTEGLVAAHQRGLVHRDIKPENIMLTPTEQVKILDFGVAKQLPQRDKDSTIESAQSTGGPSGTPGYMAPEVLLEKDSDGRADIFSLGVVFYEAFTGRHPFRAQGFLATSDRVLHGVPLRITLLNPRVPAELERIVTKMLAKRAEERYATTADLLVDLRQLERGRRVPTPRARLSMRRAVVLLAAGVAVLAVVLLFERSAVRTPTASAKYLAVESFKSLAGDPQTVFLAEGFTEAITTLLAGMGGVYVVPASADIGAPLVLEGSVQRSGDRLRIYYRLMDRKQRVALGGDVLEGEVAEIFGLQERLAADVSRLLRTELGLTTSYAAREPPTSATAYDFYLQARGYLRRYDVERNVDIAIELFQKVLSEDPQFALAHAGLGDAYWQKYVATKERQWVERAITASHAAAQLDDHLAAVHVTLGTIYQGTGEYEKAAQEFERALALDPASDDAYRGLGTAYNALGKLAEAEQTYRRAIEIRRDYWAGYSWLGAFYVAQARYKGAAEQFEQAIALTPDNVRAHLNLGGVYILMGRYEEAIMALRKANELQPTSWAYSNLGNVYFSLRRFEEAVSMFEQAAALGSMKYHFFGNLARAYYWAPGKRAQAREMYERAIRLGHEQLKVNPQNAEVHVLLAYYHAMLGHKPEASSHLERALSLRPNEPEFLLWAAVVHNQFGEQATALAWLERAVAAGYSPAEILATIELDNLRDDPKFQAMIRPK
ncbi:tetratricopeptide repeat protein, partial [Acidobacteriia bacterium AH_259_A11_L15]|nr:tetratricopeptide repeat protein [Acidobacteriia bacterium AH_259_A11_L15]